MSIEKYRIIGIDPGTNYTGYGVLEVDGKHLTSVVLGYIDMHKMDDPYANLSHIFFRVAALVDEYKPREVALESPFFGENVQSMLKLGRAQGVAMAAALSRGVDVFEYAPTKVKQRVLGSGAASKEQLSAMVKRVLKIESPIDKLDATDGMAVALCHYYTIAGRVAGVSSGDKSKGLGGGFKSDRRGGSTSWEDFIKKNPHRESNKAKKIKDEK